MTESPKQPPQRRSRRWIHTSGFPYLAKRFPPNFCTPTNMNTFLFSLAAEITLGRLDHRTASTLGYLCQLAIQTIPLLQTELSPRHGMPSKFEFISLAPRPVYSDPPGTTSTVPPNSRAPQYGPTSTREGTKP